MPSSRTVSWHMPSHRKFQFDVLAREKSKEASSNRALRSKSIVTRGKPYILRHEFDGLLGSDEDKNLSTPMLWNMYRTKHDEIHVETFVSDFCT